MPIDTHETPDGCSAAGTDRKHFVGEMTRMALESFSVRSERTGPVHRITPTGELDMATVPILEREYDAAYALDETTTIVIDLTELEFIDSTGLRLLLELNDRPADRLRVVNGSPEVQRLFDITGVRDVLPVINKNDDPLAPLG
jgi:anti-sigma B factor antagonist